MAKVRGGCEKISNYKPLETAANSHVRVKFVITVPSTWTNKAPVYSTRLRVIEIPNQTTFPGVSNLEMH